MEGADKKLTDPSLTDYAYIHVNEATRLIALWKNHEIIKYDSAITTEPSERMNLWCEVNAT